MSAQFVPCQSCQRQVNRWLEVCPYCGSDPGGDRSDRLNAAGDVPTAGTEPAESYRQIRALAIFIRLLLALFVLGTLIVMVTGWGYRDALLDLAADRPIVLDDAVQAEESYVAASGVVGWVNVVLAVTFVTWFWRAYGNLLALGRTTRRKPGWAIGSWVIPLANFVIPYGIGAEIWTKSQPDTGAPRAERNLEPVISWWALFLIMGLVNQVVFFSSRDIADQPDRMAAVVGIDLVGGLVSIAAAIAAARFVTGATDRQDSLAGRLIV